MRRCYSSVNKPFGQTSLLFVRPKSELAWLQALLPCSAVDQEVQNGQNIQQALCLT